ncbi:MAG: hypothetical protein IPG24_21145 [Leptospiraceae bacterium]|nr:hypothetical protein [Leptospiraceae bacterium]
MLLISGNRNYAAEFDFFSIPILNNIKHKMAVIGVPNSVSTMVLATKLPIVLIKNTTQRIQINDSTIKLLCVV